MKFSPLSVIKKKVRFEFIHACNVETEDIKAADHLICWVEEENARIIDEESAASVVIVKRDKKNNILYAQLLEFPMNSETDFDRLLDKFYTRKPIQFDQSILEEQAQTLEQPVSTPVIPEASAPSIGNQQAPVSEPYAPVPPMPTPTSTEGNRSDEIQQLIAAQKEQQKEIEQLKQQLEAERKAAALANEQVTEREEAIGFSKEESVLDPSEQAQSNGGAVGILDGGYEKTGASVERSTIDPELNFQDRMDRFIVQEKQKIETEILAVDKRSFIEVDITAKIQREKEDAISRLELDLYDKQAIAIEQEEKRHADEITKITQEYEKQMDSKKHLLNETYKRKVTTEVRSEYDRQTKELTALFNERMIELKKRQTELSSKLMENITLAFSELDLEVKEPQEEKKQPPTLAEITSIRVGE